MIEWNSKEMWELFNEDVKRITCYINEEGESRIHVGAENFVYETIDYIKFDNMKGGVINRPTPKPEPKVGQFGKFWTDKDYTFGILCVIDTRGLPYENQCGDWYENFEAGLPEGFDKEGNPI